MKNNAMSFKRILASTLLLGILYLPVIATPNPDSLNNDEWSWFSAISMKNDWWVLKGYASVEIKGKEIVAKLYDPNGFFRVEVKGKIDANEIKATAIRQQTDDLPRKMVGEIKNYDYGRKSIMLYEEGRPGGFVIGITKG